jgi:ABC-2 type transport system permease protein
MIKKTLRDMCLITRIYYLQFRDQVARFLFFGFLIPAGVYYIATASTGRDPALQLRFFTASILLSFSMLTIMWLGTIIVEDRFYGRLKLLITTPISRTSYVLGILGYDYILGLMTGCGFILVSYLFEIEVQLNLLDAIILVLLTLSSFTGISIIVSQQAKSLQAGTVLADSTSICLIFFAPVFYSIEELPKAMQYVASLFPTTYAADGMAKALSGKGGVGMDILALLLFSFVTLFTAIRSLRWRDL